MQTTLRVFVAPVALALLAGCPKPPAPTGPSVAPSSNVYLRTSFDTDPSDYLGRFLPEDLDELDESSGMALACSAHISWRFVDGGGVQTAEVLHASSGVRARLGVPLVGHAEGGASGQRAARVTYTLTGKMMSTIDDPAAFAACCKAQPDQCTDRMVGEFIQGTGAVYLQASQGADLEAELHDPRALVDGELTVSHGVAWRRAAVFDNPVYFAFKATPTPYTQRAVRTCSEWTGPVPTSPEGLVLRAASGPAWTEQGARKRARTALSAQVDRTTGLADEARTKGTVLGIQEQDWCVERVEEDGHAYFAAHVLGLVSHAEQARVRDLPQPAPPPPAPAPVESVTEYVGSPCADWVDHPPIADDGVTVVGRHTWPALTEAGARLQARANAQTLAGRVTGLGGLAFVNGTKIGVQERGWCVERTRTGQRVRYRAQMLGFVSDEEQARIQALPTLAEQTAALQASAEAQAPAP